MKIHFRSYIYDRIVEYQWRRRRGQRGLVPPHFQKWGGGHKWVCAPPPPHTFEQTKFVVKNAKFS